MLRTSALIILLIIIKASLNLNGNTNNKQQQIIPTDKNGLTIYFANCLEHQKRNTEIGKKNIQWLITNRTKYFNTDNVFSKTTFYCEMSSNNNAIEKHDLTNLYLDSALQILPAKLFPELNFKILEYGEQMARRNRTYAVQISYLKRMYNSGLLPKTSKKLADILLDIAEYSWNMHKYDQSTEYCKKVLPVIQAQSYWEGKIRALLLMYHNSHFSTNDTTWHSYLDQALKIAEQSGDSTQLSKVYYTIGYSHYRENEHIKAIDYYKKSRSFERIKGSPAELTTAIMQKLSYSIADSVEAVNKTSAYIIEQGKKNNLYNVLGNAYRSRAWYFAKIGQKDSASNYLKKAFDHRQSFNDKKDASPGFYYYLYEVAMLIPDFELALKYLNLSAAQTRQISMKTNAKELGAARADLDYLLQRERIDRLTLENNLEHEKTKKQKVIIFAVLSISFLGLVFLFIVRRNHKKLNSTYYELVKKNKELDKVNQQLRKAEYNSKQNGNNHSNGKSIKDEDVLYRNLKILFEEDKIYKDPHLSIRKLADHLGTNTTYLSMVINHRFEESFKTILNKYRVNEARLILETKQYANLTIEGIAEKVGYHSRSTFYNAFKEITGLTPTQYLNNIVN
ncbi:helix-turn-helix domain-containing protein [Draconibacterium halophilum]|uniref:AraC family transcriptional regulator n=1 Tax=Draconibacterium halophilum TaxID=2706887 RepID=A0A6C0RE78_9BACT|nr:helix-turn-helix domain-containing protein [Draconibacterium halophilum]QIA08419.1 AraC family transcriptional regulator [Draconibacterium halophilum]